LDSYKAIKWDKNGGWNGKGDLSLKPYVKKRFVESKNCVRKNSPKFEGYKRLLKDAREAGIIPQKARANPREIYDLLKRSEYEGR
jgi:hypothetical protein